MPSVKDEIDQARADGYRDGRAYELNRWNCYLLEMLGFQECLVGEVRDAQDERDVALRRVAELEALLSPEAVVALKAMHLRITSPGPGTIMVDHQ